MAGDDLDENNDQDRRIISVSHRRQYGAITIDYFALVLLVVFADFVFTGGSVDWIDPQGNYYVFEISVAYFLIAALLYRGASFGMKILGLSVMHGASKPDLILILVRSVLGFYIIGLATGVLTVSGLLNKKWPYDPIFGCRMVREAEE